MDKEKLMAELEIDEGLKLYPYKCTSNRWTIGVGHNFEDNPFTIDELIFIGIKGRTFETILEELSKKGISRGDAFYVLENDIDKSYEQLKKSLPWFDSIPDVAQRVLVNMSFMGISKLLKFKNMLAAIKQNNWIVASKELLNSQYALQVGDRAKRLSRALLTLSK